MKSKSATDKGKLLENYVADQIKAKGLDNKAYRSHGSGSGNREKGDIWTKVAIFGRNLGIECKNQKTLAIPDWWRQTKKLEVLGREPVLAFKIHNESIGEAKVVIYLDTFLDLVKASQGTVEKKELDQPSFQKKYHENDAQGKIQYAIKVLQIAIKLINKS